MRSYEQLPESGDLFLKPFHYPDYIRISTVVILVFLAFGFYFSKQSLRAAQCYNKAEALQKVKEYDKAREWYQEALHYAPRSEDIKIALATDIFAAKDSTKYDEGMRVLEDITLTDNEWKRLKEVLPLAYQEYFETKTEY